MNVSLWGHLMKNTLVALILTLTATACSNITEKKVIVVPAATTPESKIDKHPEGEKLKKVDGKSPTYTSDNGYRTTTSTYTNDMTLKEVCREWVTSLERDIYRADGKTLFWKSSHDKRTKHCTNHLFGPDGKLRLTRTFYLDIEGEIGWGVRTTERMDVVYWNEAEEEEYTQYWTRGQSAWTLWRVLKPIGGTYRQRTELELGQDENKNATITVYTSSNFGLNKRIYSMQTLPNEYKLWVQERYADEDPTLSEHKID